MSKEMKKALKNRYVRFLIVWCLVSVPLLFLFAGFIGLEEVYVKHTKEYLISVLVGSGVLIGLVGFWLEKKNDKKDNT